MQIITVAGHLREQNGVYQMILSYKDSTGKRKAKSISTRLPVKGNKRRAEEMLAEAKKELKDKLSRQLSDSNSPLFTTYMRGWLEDMKPGLAPSSYASYRCIIEESIVPYFTKKHESLLLSELEEHPEYIKNFYKHELDRGLKPASVKRRHANIRKALQQALKMRLIKINPADLVELPKQKTFTANYYTAAEIKELFEAAKDDPLYIAILFAAYYGLRRSEILGLKWSAVNFRDKCFTVKYTVVEVSKGKGKGNEVIGDSHTKTALSRRTLPLSDHFISILLEHRQKQEESKRLFGRGYTDSGFICTDALGMTLKPDYVTNHFKRLLRKKGLKAIRFHDLRHSCASLMIKAGVHVKEAQAILGHSRASTTLDIYGHLDYESKIKAINSVVGSLEEAKIETENNK